MKAENARFDYSKELQIENKKSVVKEKRKMSELERITEEAKTDVITISRDEFLRIAAEQITPGSKLAELIEKQPMLMLLHMLITVDLADALFRKKEEEKESEE
jgi:hypothetical protein